MSSFEILIDTLLGLAVNFVVVLLLCMVAEALGQAAAFIEERQKTSKQSDNTSSAKLLMIVMHLLRIITLYLPANGSPSRFR